MMSFLKVQDMQRCILEKEGSFSFAEVPQPLQMAELIEVKRKTLVLD
jgi:hypothetical protein